MNWLDGAATVFYGFSKIKTSSSFTHVCSLYVRLVREFTDISVTYFFQDFARLPRHLTMEPRHRGSLRYATVRDETVWRIQFIITVSRGRQ